MTTIRFDNVILEEYSHGWRVLTMHKDKEGEEVGRDQAYYGKENLSHALKNVKTRLRRNSKHIDSIDSLERVEKEATEKIEKVSKNLLTSLDITV